MTDIDNDGTELSKMINGFFIKNAWDHNDIISFFGSALIGCLINAKASQEQAKKIFQQIEREFHNFMIIRSGKAE